MRLHNVRVNKALRRSAKAESGRLPAAVPAGQKTNSQSRMMIGIGMPMSHRRSERNIRISPSV